MTFYLNYLFILCVRIHTYMYAQEDREQPAELGLVLSFYNGALGNQLWVSELVAIMLII